MSDTKNLSSIQKMIVEKNKERDQAPKRGNILPERLQNCDEDQILFSFNQGAPIVEIHGKSENTYTVKFYDSKNQICLKEHLEVKPSEWVQANEEYYVPWIINIENNNTKKVMNYSINMENKLVFIVFESNALGDTIAWIPVVEEFRKKYKARVFCSTFHNHLFENEYPEINFVDRATKVEGLQLVYRIGWFGDGRKSFRNKYDAQTRNLQQHAMDILGLDYNEIGEVKTKFPFSKKARLIKKKYVAITTCSTAQMKYWNYNGGWQEIVDYLIKKGYEVVNVGKAMNNLFNVIDATGQRSMDDLTNIIQNCEFFIGLPSGLSWVSWALNKKTIMITGISEHYCEFKYNNYRVENISVCHGCFNKTEDKFIFDRGNFLFCPYSDLASEKFICTKEITPEMVKNKIKLVENHIKNNIETSLDNEGNLVSIKTGKIISKYGE